MENGTVIFQVQATDADYGINSIVTYSLLPSEYKEKYFIDASSGNITVTGTLDRENTSKVTLRIQATDGKFRTNTTLVINVEDVNDNYPYFTSSSYSANVSENIPTGYLIMNVTAQDKDSGSNGQLTYSLVQRPHGTAHSVNEIFALTATNGAITTLKRLKLNAFRVEYKFQVKAADNGNPSLESFANVSITVEDVNDSPPVFTKCKTLVTFQAPPDLRNRLFHVSASDADYGPNASVTYSIINGKDVETCSAYFVIDHNGSIYSQQELWPGFNCNITISATDGVQTGVCSVNLQVKKDPDTTGEWYFYLVVEIATTRYCSEVKRIPEHIPFVISVSSRIDSLMFASSSVFPKEELRCIIGLCRRLFRYF